MIFRRNLEFTLSRSIPHRDCNGFQCSEWPSLGKGCGNDKVARPLGRKRDIDVATQFEASVRKACRREGGVGVDVTAHAIGELNAGAVPWVAIAITSFGPVVNAPGEVDNDVTLTLPSPRPMNLQDPGVGARNSVDVFEALIDDAVDHVFQSKCSKMLRKIVCRKKHEVFRHAIQSHQPARVKHMIVWLQRDAGMVRVRPYQTVIASCGMR